MEKESFKLTGSVTYELYGPDGKLKNKKVQENVVVTVGKTYLANWLTAATQSGYFMQYIAVGTGTSGSTAGETTLETEIGTRQAGSLSNASNVWQNQATFAAGNATGAITEAGILSAVSSGTLFTKQSFSEINKAAGDSLQVTWNVTFS
jgi:hypothetical protein